MDSNSPPIVFHVNRPCVTQEEHVGREHILQQAFTRLNTDDVQSFAIIGLSKMGKSSFINHLQQPEVVEKFINPKERAKKYLFLLLDCAKYSLDSEEDFFKFFYQEIEKLLGLSNLNNMIDLERVTQKLFEDDLRLVVILENFNLVVTNPNFSVVFYDGLRSWFSTHVNVGCIVTSPLQLLDLAIPLEIAGSPFFNIFSAYSLKPFSLTEATQLLDDRLPKALRGHEKEIFDVIDHVGFNPYELQIAGYIWIKHFQKTKEMTFEDTIDEVYQALIPYYNKIYSDLTSRQIRDIRKILKKDYKDLMSIDQNLVAYGWVTKDKKNIVAKQMKRYFSDRLKINSNNGIIKKIKLFFTKLILFK